MRAKRLPYEEFKKEIAGRDGNTVFQIFFFCHNLITQSADNTGV